MVDAHNNPRAPPRSLRRGRHQAVPQNGHREAAQGLLGHTTFCLKPSKLNWTSADFLNRVGCGFDSHRGHPFAQETIVSDVLALNADFSVLDVVPWERAVGLLMTGKVYAVESYAGKVVRSPTTAVPWPAVVVWCKTATKQRKIRFSRQNVLARDAYTCQFCGARPKRANGKPDIGALTLDHVVPRAQSEGGWVVTDTGRRVRLTSWENAVTACEACNTFKAARTPQEAGLTLRRAPQEPYPLQIAWMAIVKSQAIPPEWRDYLPAESPWRDYWDGELEAE